MPIFAEGYEGDSWVNLLTRGWTSPQTPTLAVTHAHQDFSGRGGVRAATFGASTTWTSPSFGTTGRWFGYYLKALGIYSSSTAVSFVIGGTDTFTVEVLATGFINLRRGGIVGTIVATSASATSLGVAHWIDVELLAQDAGGVCNVYLDNSLVVFVTFSGDTRASATTNGFEQLKFQAFGGSLSTATDDYVVNTNAEGRVFETYISRRAVVSNDVIQSTSSGGGAGTFANVDELPPTSADYNEFDDTEQDTYGIAAGTWTPAMFWGVKIAGYAARDGLIVNYQSVCKSGATTSLATAQALAGSGVYKLVDDLFNTDPDTGVAWTLAGVDATKIGVKFTV